MGDFSLRWERASPAVTAVAMVLNHHNPIEIVIHESTWAEQNALLEEAEKFIAELQGRGLILLHPDDHALQHRLTEFMLDIFKP